MSEIINISLNKISEIDNESNNNNLLEILRLVSDNTNQIKEYSEQLNELRKKLASLFKLFS